MESDDESIDGTGLEELQHRLQQKLDSMLEDTIGPSKKRKKSEEPRRKKKQSKDHSSHCELNSNVQQDSRVSRLNPPKTTEPKRNTVATLKKIQDLTSAAKREKQRSTSAKLMKERHAIQAKIRNSCDLNIVHKQESGDDSSECEDADDCPSPEERLDDVQMFDSDDSFSEDDFEESNLEHDSSKPRRNNQVEKFKKALGITDADLQHAREKQQQIKQGGGQRNTQVKTLGLLKGNRKRFKPEVVVFEDPARRSKSESKAEKKKSKPEDPLTEGGDPADNPEFDLQRARYEVRKFGIKGLQGDNKEKGMIDLLVSLGAKPPKKGSVNYKELQAQRKQEQMEEIQKKNMDRKLGFRVVGSKNKRRGRDKNDVRGVDGQIGTYRSGVQVVGKKAIEKVNKKPGRRR